MIFINSKEIRYFYRNIIKTGKVYRIKYKNKDYGEFKKLSDALYERDALYYCNFDYDLLVECDLDNKYENMELPPFPKKRPHGRIKGVKKINKKAKEGEILFDHKMKLFYIKKDDTIYDYYQTMSEAYYYKKKLIANDWDINCLIDTISKVIKINKKLDVNKIYKVKLNYCPHCKHKINNDTEECPYCGIKIKEY